MKSREEEFVALGEALHSLTSGNPHGIPPAHLKSYFTPFVLRLMATR
ncbi:MAG: hypothetical protein ACYC8S_01090 [Minisyncoccota bacterium]